MRRLLLVPALSILASCSGAPDALEASGGVHAESETATVQSGGANLVVHVDGRTFVMLEDEVAEGVADGEPTLLSKENEVMTVTRAFAASKVPGSVLSAKSKTVTVVADSNTRCEATVTDAMIFTQVIPSWDEEQMQQSDRGIAHDAYELGERGAHYALALDLPRESCTGAHFALLSGDAVTARPTPVNEAAVETVVSAFRELPSAHQYDERYSDFLSARDAAEDKANGLDRGTSWDTYSGGAPSVHRFVIGDESLLFVTAGSDEGCGGFNATMSALFRETNEGPVVVRVWEDFSREALGVVASPTGYDVIFDNVKARTSDKEPVNVEPQYYGCRC